MTALQRQTQRALWLLLAPLAAAVLALAARLPTDVPANVSWPAALPVEPG
jgi:hypothetical protein